MSKVFFIIALAIEVVAASCSAGYAQTYIPLYDNDVYWNVTWDDQGCFMSGTPTGEYTYMSGNDTMISGVTYKTLYRSGLCNLCCHPPVGPANGYMGSIKNDTTSKIVLFIPAGHLFADTLYDFNLAVGDTLKTILASLCQNAHIISIDSIFLNQVYHKKYNFSGSPCQGSLIEGIGSTLGLLEPFITFDAKGTLLCVTLNGQTIYPDSSSICNQITSASMPDFNNDLLPYTLLINNSTVQIDFKSENILPVKLLITSIDGRIIYQKDILTNRECTLNDGIFSDGIYFLNVIGKDQKLSTRFIICRN